MDITFMSVFIFLVAITTTVIISSSNEQRDMDERHRYPAMFISRSGETSPEGCNFIVNKPYWIEYPDGTITRNQKYVNKYGGLKGGLKP